MPADLTFLSLLPLEVDTVESLKDPDVPVDSNEEVLGVAGPSLKKLYTLWRLAGYEAEKLLLEIRFKGDLSTETQVVYERLKSREECLGSLFWYSVKDNHNLWANRYTTLGIRQGWKIVGFNTSNPFEAMGKLFGL